MQSLQMMVRSIVECAPNRLIIQSYSRCSRELRLQIVPPPPAQQQTVRTHNPTPTLIPPPPPSFSVWNLRTRGCPTPPGCQRRGQRFANSCPAHGLRMVRAWFWCQAAITGGRPSIWGGGRPNHIFSIEIYDCWGCVRAWVFHYVSGVLARWFGR